MIQIDILGRKGHEELKFEDAATAKTKIDELLGKRYACFAEIGGETHKIKSVDVEKSEYICEAEKRVPMAEAKVTATAPQAGG